MNPHLMTHDDTISPELLSLLLKDHTLSLKEGSQVNIHWFTHDYEQLGLGYSYHDQISPERITGSRGQLIMPRVMKEQQVQDSRKRDKAEVFTPAWICNCQNNLIDAEWFGRPDVFNRELPDHTWEPTPAPIAMPEGRTWMDYVRDTRLEITCGEAPYLVSRYDTTTGRPIPLGHRIGLLDRKLRIVSEHATTGQWLYWAKEALRAIYAYEWQGDSLLLARENIFATFVEWYEYRFRTLRHPSCQQYYTPPCKGTLLEIANIISWNIFQMDGLKAVIPNSCKSQRIITYELDGTKKEEIIPCPGCKQKFPFNRLHNGTRALIMDWEKRTPKEFISLSSNG